VVLMPLQTDMSRPLFHSGSLKSSASGLSRGTTLATDNFSHSLQLPVTAPIRTDLGLNTDHVSVKTDRHGRCIYVDSEERRLAGADEDWMCCHRSTEFLQSTRAPTLSVPSHRGLSLSFVPLVLCPLVIRDVPIFKIQPESDSTGYQMNYPAGTGTGYLNTCCIAIFLDLCVV